MFSQKGIAVVSEGGRYGVINQKGEYILPPQMDEIGDFDADGYAYMRIGGMMGIVNDKGEYVINPMFNNMCTSETYVSPYEGR